MRDEEMALRDEEVTGELPEDLEYEEFNENPRTAGGDHRRTTCRVQNQTSAAGIGLVVREYLSQYPRARHFDVARIVD